MAGIDDEMLGLLACPLCLSTVKMDGGRICCTNASCGCRYVVKDEIPVMLIDEAERPCPSCGAQRDWNEDNVLTCPKCASRFEAKREPPIRSR
jgi:hypothetical protein